MYSTLYYLCMYVHMYLVVFMYVVCMTSICRNYLGSQWVKCVQRKTNNQSVSQSIINWLEGPDFNFIMYCQQEKKDFIKILLKYKNYNYKKNFTFIMSMDLKIMLSSYLYLPVWYLNNIRLKVLLHESSPHSIILFYWGQECQWDPN